VTNSFWDVLTTGTTVDGSGGGSTGLTTAQFQSGGAGALGSAFGGGANGLYPFLTTFFPNGAQAVSGFAFSSPGVAASGARVSLFSGGALVGGSVISAGANGYVYTIVPAGTFPSTGNTIGATITLAGASAVSGLSYADSLSLDFSGNLTAPSVTSGRVSEATGLTSESALATSLGTTFGAANFSALSTALNGAPLQITAGGAFTIDQAISNAGTISVSAGAGAGLTIASNGSVTSTASGVAVTLSTSGAFINDAGSGAVSTPNPNGSWLIYSANPTGDAFDGLNSNNTAVWDTAAGASVSDTGDRYVFAFQPTLTFTSINDSTTAGTNATAQVAGDFTVTGNQPGVVGAFLGDALASTFTGAPSVTSPGASATAAPGAYAITVSSGALASPIGYAFAFNNAGVLTVTSPPPTSPTPTPTSPTPTPTPTSPTPVPLTPTPTPTPTSPTPVPLTPTPTPTRPIPTTIGTTAGVVVDTSGFSTIITIAPGLTSDEMAQFMQNQTSDSSASQRSCVRNEAACASVPYSANLAAWPGLRFTGKN
jgi:hypothetical protein